MSRSDPQSYLSRRHAAERLDVSTRTIDRLRDARELGWLRVGGVVRIELASIEAYLERQRARRHEDIDPGVASLAPVARLPIPALDELREQRRGEAVRRTHPR